MPFEYQILCCTSCLKSISSRLPISGYFNPHFFQKINPGQRPVNPAKSVKPTGTYNTHEALSNPVCQIPVLTTAATVKNTIL